MKIGKLPDFRPCGWGAGALCLLPGLAVAHEIIPGVTGLPGMVLHPLAVPDYLLCLLTAGLAAARAKGMMLIASPPLFAAGVLAGQFAQGFVPFSTLFLVLSVMACGSLAVFLALLPRIPFSFAAIAIAGLGGVIGIQTVPEGPAIVHRIEAAGGAMIAGALIILLLGWPLAKVTAHWGHVLPRIASAWIAAISMMIFALNYRIALSGF